MDLTAKNLKYRTILADPPWRFDKLKILPYNTMSLEDICNLPVKQIAHFKAHLYLWIPNALLRQGLIVMDAWGFRYTTCLPWVKVKKTFSDVVDARGGRGWFKGVTETLLFGTRKWSPMTRAIEPGVITAARREHSRKPDEVYHLIEKCSYGPYLELFARYRRSGWDQWGDQLERNPKMATYYCSYFKDEAFNPHPKQQKWYGYHGDQNELIKYLHSIWDCQVPNLASFSIGLSNVDKRVAKDSEVEQIGVLRVDGTILKYYAGADEGIEVGPITRIPKSLELIKPELGTTPKKDKIST